jgi:periplasmic divalent cation tolerance protein
MPDTPSSDAPAFPAPADNVRILLTTAPPDQAQDIARALVEERLAACVSLLPGVRSVYRWKEAVHDDPETVLLVKTTADRLETLSTRYDALHPYEVPEALVLEPAGGSAAYVAWLEAQTVPAPEAG